MADEEFDSPDVMLDLLGERQCIADEARKALPQRVVEALDVGKRSLIETVNDQLKNISQIEHSRHRSLVGFRVNLVAGLTAYTYQPKKPSLGLWSGEAGLPVRSV